MASAFLIAYREERPHPEPEASSIHSKLKNAPPGALKKNSAATPVKRRHAEGAWTGILAAKKARSLWFQVASAFCFF